MPAGSVLSSNGRVWAGLLRASVAVWLNPEAGAPHFTAGEMLVKMGRRTLAVHEWETILKIPPDDRIYDINAYMRLGAICEACGLHQRSADAYSKGLEEVTVTINGKEHEWDQLFQGVTFDHLPNVLDITIEGVRPSGRRHKMPFRIEPLEPPIR